MDSRGEVGVVRAVMNENDARALAYGDPPTPSDQGVYRLRKTPCLASEIPGGSARRDRLGCQGLLDVRRTR